ncbi:hypothetical protein NM688_g7409 [Phlebia brevispora]|uniref:Uncharacterized protein n=1 Tax=Phlebia brevispora TaxID=194682 RepID=A0ACC1S5J5_9APHY|nr:hypothetical protein NM688_g7409 [Phlebia brevispora]
MQALPRLALLVGSSRHGGNGAGLAEWLSSLLERRLNTLRKAVEIVVVDPTKPPHPVGPVVDGSKVPAQIPDSSSYSSLVIRHWSEFVSSCSAFAIITPEYNAGYPGELKNSLDHLYREWSGKPVMLVTYGGGGGLRCSAALQTVLQGLKMHVVESPVGITLPKQFTGGPERVQPGHVYPEFLSPYEELINKAADTLKDKILVDVKSAEVKDVVRPN